MELHPMFHQTELQAKSILPSWNISVSRNSNIESFTNQIRVSDSASLSFSLSPTLALPLPLGQYTSQSDLTKFLKQYRPDAAGYKIPIKVSDSRERKRDNFSSSNSFADSFCHSSTLFRTRWVQSISPSWDWLEMKQC